MASQVSSTQGTASNVGIRRASAQDARGILAVLQAITSERVHSAIERPWDIDQQLRYMNSLSVREAFHVAVVDSGQIVGYQSLDLYSTLLSSMAHVGQLGTFLLPEWRGRGVGRALFRETCSFARSSGYRKIVIHVRASNQSAKAFYQWVGFRECGRLSRQVVIDGREDDEIIMEFFL
jgi:ribosomal protein S18 acetylase RimI-like enzyme